MRFPSWRDIKEKVAEFQQRVQDFRKNNPMISGAIEATIAFLPSPFNTIAEKIYSGTAGSPEDKIEAVQAYLEKILNRGEEHYENITSKLDVTLAGIEDIKNLGAKESTLQSIQEVLIANSDRANEILQSLEKVDIKLDSMDSKLDVIVKIMGATERINQMTPAGTDSPDESLYQPQGKVVAEKHDNIINLKIGDNIVESIESNSLIELGASDLDALSKYEENMRLYQEKILNLESAVANAVDANIKFQYKKDIDRTIDEMCSQLEHINDILKPIGINLTNYYRSISKNCEKRKNR